MTASCMALPCPSMASFVLSAVSWATAGRLKKTPANKAAIQRISILSACDCPENRLEPPLEEPPDRAGRFRRPAARFEDRIGRKEMACALNNDVPRVETSLFQRQQEVIRLSAIDDVVLGTIHDKE